MPASVRPRRRRLVLAAIVTAAVLVYGTVVALYGANQASRIGGECDPSEGAVVVDLVPASVDAQRDRITVDLAISDAGPIETSSLGFTQPVTLVVDGADGDRSFTTPADSVPSTVSVSLFAEGEAERWPFDGYVARARFVVVQTVDDEPDAFETDVCATGQVLGWTLTATPADGSDDLTVNGEAVPFVVITATRSPATLAFGLVLIALLITLPVLGLTVAIAAFRGRRKVEATLMSWMAAMLFAVVPLRGFLPGSPPIGSWVDYLVVLWVVGGLVAALVVYVLAWLRWTPAAGERPQR